MTESTLPVRETEAPAAAKVEAPLRADPVLAKIVAATVDAAARDVLDVETTCGGE